MRLTVIAACVAMAGCAAPVPVAEHFPLVHQRVARTAQHWDVVAADVVAQTATSLQSHPALKGRPIVVGSGFRQTAFNAAFRNFLTNHLVNTGMQVNVCRVGGVVQSGFVQEAPEVQVTYEVQHIHHATAPYYRPGFLTALTAGVVVGRALAVSNFDGTEASLIALGIAGLADVGLGHSARPTRTEIIITTTIADQNRFIMRRSDIYYVPEGDTALFVSSYAHPSLCPTVAGMQRSTVDQARDDMLVEAMRRSNPLWRRPE